MDEKIKKIKKVVDKKLESLIKEDKPRDKKLKLCDKCIKRGNK